MSHRRAADERGAILIQVGVALIVLMAFSMFVVDYGILWVSRGQAQNSADAGALAGAVALALDDADDYTDAGPAKRAARGLALANLVFATAPDVQFTDITFSRVDASTFPTVCATANCIRVNVFRNQARGNWLPTWFGSLVGVNQQGVRATAIAWAASGNASRCLKPWGVADKWNESDPGGWTPTSEFDPADGDTYTPPNASSPGTGFTLAADLGTEIRLKVGSPHDAINPGWFQALDLTGGGGSQYRQNIRGCVGNLWGIGDEIPKENGNMVGPTGQGTSDLIDLDPGADWNETTDRIEGSCVENNSCVDANGDPVTYSESPRIVAIPIFDLAYYLQTGGPGNGTVRVVNILGFFVDRIENPQNTVVGYLSSTIELLDGGAGQVHPDASFVKVIQLVR
jgi:Flp pilus assembly protein TadG